MLAGVGSDGTIGIRTIKELGGLTLAQAERDATAMRGMPSSAAATGLVDHVVPVEAMPAQLIDYHKHITAVAEKKDGDGHRKDMQDHIASITSLLHRRSEHDFSGYKETTLLRRIQRRMQVLHIDNALDYVERLKTDQGEVEALFRELLIGVTQFFRDPEAFQALKDSALVPLLRGKDKGEPIRVWVPGCSTGEEVYSVAILLREVLQEGEDNRAVMIFGTDIDSDAVAIARAGRYGKEASGLSPEHFAKWFATDGAEYCPIADVRDMCVFSTHSLVKDPPFSRLDLISCRNVLIYLEEELQDRLMRTFHYSLLPWGYLFLGSAEGASRNSRLFTARDKKHRILQRRDVGTTLPQFQPQGMSTLPPAPPPVRRHRGEDRIDKAIARVMQQCAPAYFVIDRNHEISRFSGAETGAYLEPSEGAASLNLFNIIRKALRPAVRAAVNQALAEGRTVTNDDLTIRIDGKPRLLTLIVEPIGGENGAKAPGGCVLAFRYISPPGATAPVEPTATTSDAHVQAMEKELHATKAQLQAATDELETRIQDMRTTTEEFQAINEELQSSNEELETAKEEMQSVNEELQTINSELNNKNELLTRLNSDMQNLLDSTQIATVFLDGQLRIRYFTPALTQLFPVRDSDLGRPIIQIVTDLDYTTIQADVIAVQRDGSVVERDLALKNGEQVFVMRIRPYRTPTNVGDGVVITFVDITERKHAEERQQLLSHELQHRTNNLLAVIQSVAGQSLSGTQSLDQAREALTARLHALANANALLTQSDWRGAPLKDVITRELASFVSRATIEGPPLLLNLSATQGFALVIHELATNAAKHGALSTPAGRVTMHWSVNQMGNPSQFSFSWQESGGPPVVPPERKGFGTTLLKSAIGGADATPNIEYAPNGVRYTLEAPLSAIAAVPRRGDTTGGA